MIRLSGFINPQEVKQSRKFYWLFQSVSQNQNQDQDPLKQTSQVLLRDGKVRDGGHDDRLSENIHAEGQEVGQLTWRSVAMRRGHDLTSSIFNDSRTDPVKAAG